MERARAATPVASAVEQRGGWDRQREAANRNRQAILDAASRLFAEHGIDGVDVRQIASEAGVGMGTLYRRFGDKASVIAALIGDQERALQDALLRGPPPLGPGAPALQRLEAFLLALAALTERNLELLYASESAAPGGRYRIGAYGAWHQHTAILVEEIDQTLDVDWTADLLLAPLAASLYRHHRRDRGLGAQQIAHNLAVATRRLLPSSGSWTASP
jgi:AcrR family transcriptional regulator